MSGDLCIESLRSKTPFRSRPRIHCCKPTREIRRKLLTQQFCPCFSGLIALDISADKFRPPGRRRIRIHLFVSRDSNRPAIHVKLKKGP